MGALGGDGAVAAVERQHVKATRAQVREAACLLIPCPAGALPGGGPCEALAGEVCVDRLANTVPHATHRERMQAWAGLSELEQAMLKIKWEDERGEQD